MVVEISAIRTSCECSIRNHVKVRTCLRTSTCVLVECSSCERQAWLIETDSPHSRSAECAKSMREVVRETLAIRLDANGS